MKNHGRWFDGPGSGSPGFSLVEVVLAIAVIAVTFLGLLGLLGVGVVNDQTSSQQTTANNIAQSIVSDLRSTSGNVPSGSTYSPAAKSPRFQLTIPTANTASAATPLSGATPVVLYFDNNATYLQTGGAAPSSAAYAATVYLVQLSYIGNGPAGKGTSQYNDLARVVVAWPARTTTTPVGSVEIVSQFLLH